MQSLARRADIFQHFPFARSLVETQGSSKAARYISNLASGCVATLANDTLIANRGKPQCPFSGTLDTIKQCDVVPGTPLTKVRYPGAQKSYK